VQKFSLDLTCLKIIYLKLQQNMAISLHKSNKSNYLFCFVFLQLFSGAQNYDKIYRFFIIGLLSFKFNFNWYYIVKTSLKANIRNCS